MNWWQRLLRRRKMEDQLEKELGFHLDQHASELIAKGLSPDEARRQARLALGGPEQVKENCRDARGTRWLEDLLQDFLYAIRMLGKQPGFAAVALLTLALGIGATTVMFTVFNGVLLKPLPYPEPGRLVAVHGHTDSWNTAVYGEQNLAYLDFRNGQRQSRSLAMAGFRCNGGIVGTPGNPEYADRREISSNLFSVLGVPIERGRAFLPEEDQPGAAPVIILGNSFWQRRFANNPNALGLSLILDDKSYTVVGIAPAGFRLDGEEPDVFTPVGQNTAGFLRNRRAHPIWVVARLRPGTKLQEAQSELAVVGHQLAGQYPDSNAGRSFVAAPLRPGIGDVRSTLWLLLGAVGLVLLIACANVASLLLARAVSRERELAMRVALGASSGRLMRQCLTESAVLGLSGGVLGVLVAAAMLGRTLLRLSSVNPGVNIRNVLVTRMALSPAALANPARIRAAWQDVLDRARRVPGVESVAAVDTFPMRQGENQLGYWNTPAVPPENQQPLALATSVTPDYPKVMGIPLLKGRFFDDHDRRGSEPVIVIDEVLAQQAFGTEEPVGKRLWIPEMSGPNWTGSSDPVYVVGVVGHVRHWGLARDDQAQVRAQFYYPFAQVPDMALRRWSELMSIAVRTSIPPLNAVEPLRRELRGATGGAGGDQALYEVRTLEQLASDSLARQRFLLLLFAIFAGLALLLACIGIYGVLAYLTSQRVREIGVRMALGATTGEVTRMVLGQSLGMIFVGVGVGILAALGAGRLLAHTVDGMQSTGLSTFIITIPILVVAALMASYGPARRASRIDPISALRQD